MSETDRLIETVRQRQLNLGESDATFAARLGVNREMWRLLRLGKCQPGRRSLRGIAQAFPDLKFDIAASLFLPSNVGIPTETENTPTLEHSA